MSHQVVVYFISGGGFALGPWPEKLRISARLREDLHPFKKMREEWHKKRRREDDAPPEEDHPDATVSPTDS